MDLDLADGNSSEAEGRRFSQNFIYLSHGFLMITYFVVITKKHEAFSQDNELISG